MMGTKARVFEMLPPGTLGIFIPPDHFYRHLEHTLDLSFVRDLVCDAYAETRAAPRSTRSSSSNCSSSCSSRDCARSANSFGSSPIGWLRVMISSTGTRVDAAGRTVDCSDEYPHPGFFQRPEKIGGARPAHHGWDRPSESFATGSRNRVAARWPVLSRRADTDSSSQWAELALGR